MEREVKKRIVEFVLISQGNILQITTCWETQWKENFPAAPYSICYMFTSMGKFFFLTNSNEYLIRKQLRTFTSMQSYFQLKKNTAQHFETFDTLDLYMSGFLYSNKKKHCHPSELWIFSNNHTQLYNFFKYKAYCNKT